LDRRIDSKRTQNRLRYSPDDKDDVLSFDALDRAFKAYCEEADRTDGATINAVINAIGIAFGQYLIDHLGLEWATVTDKFGCELAVVGMRGTADFLVFPPNFVAKRWERKEVDFLKRSYDAIAADYTKCRTL
jgi:hypothetical protein